MRYIIKSKVLTQREFSHVDVDNPDGTVSTRKAVEADIWAMYEALGLATSSVGRGTRSNTDYMVAILKDRYQAALVNIPEAEKVPDAFSDMIGESVPAAGSVPPSDLEALAAATSSANAEDKRKSRNK